MHGRGEKSVKSLVESLKETAYLKDCGVDERMGLEWILGRMAGETLSGCT
jgi:hypothetical protein